MKRRPDRFQEQLVTNARGIRNLPDSATEFRRKIDSRSFKWTA